jgi:prepilin-type processing-associated H-X9-DG protein
MKGVRARLAELEEDASPVSVFNELLEVALGIKALADVRGDATALDGPEREPRKVPAADIVGRLYPAQRHTNTFNVLYCDGHVAPMTQAGLTAGGVAQFLADGSTVTFP